MEQESIGIEDKVRRFSETMADGLIKAPVVFCVNCGSTNIDQNFISQLQCYDCREISLWNGRKFGISRGGSAADVESSLLPDQTGDRTHWHAEAVETIYDWGKDLCQVMSLNPQKPDMASEDISPQERERLIASWEQTKAKIDALLA